MFAGALLFVDSHVTARGGGGLSPKTQENLSTAMRGEAFAYAKYQLYAKHAEQNGNTELAKLFRTAANIERFQHFAEEAQLAGLVGSDADNLKDATKPGIAMFSKLLLAISNSTSLVGGSCLGSSLGKAGTLCCSG